MALLQGCAQAVLSPDINAAAIRLLTRHGIEVVLCEEERCCGALEHHLDGRKLAGVKRRLELLRPGELHRNVVAGHKPIHLDRLASAEGYFRALADGLRM